MSNFENNDDNKNGKIIDFNSKKSEDIESNLSNINMIREMMSYDGMPDDDLDDEVYEDTLPVVLSSSTKIEDTKELDKDIEQVIDELVDDEVRRMKRNLAFIDLLEVTLADQIKIRSDAGTLDLVTLQKVLSTMNASIDRSNKIIKDKQSSLLQVLIDARTQSIDNSITVNNENVNKLPELSVRSRKKLRSIFEALLNDETNTDSSKEGDENE